MPQLSQPSFAINEPPSLTRTPVRVSVATSEQVYGRTNVVAYDLLGPKQAIRLSQFKLIGLAISLLVAAMFVAAVGVGAKAPTTTVKVEAGQSLWSIAAANYPDLDTRSAMQVIVDANHLDGTSVAPGETLVLPPE